VNDSYLSQSYLFAKCDDQYGNDDFGYEDQTQKEGVLKQKYY